jgi:acetyl esterase/lipase
MTERSEMRKTLLEAFSSLPRTMRSGVAILLAVTVAACTTVSAPESTASQVTGVDALAHVHPELRQAAEAVLNSDWQFTELSNEDLEKLRGSASGYAPEGLPVNELHIPGPKGAPDVRVLVVNSEPGASRPGLLYLHGGGYVFGSARSDIPRIRELATELDCVVVSVDYRLAPETRWSGSLEDNYAGLKWLHDNSDTLGVDRTRIAVMGNSAGGGHAALLAIAARDRGEVPLVFQSLIYPMLDDRTGSSRAVPMHIGNIVWTARANQYGWRSFLGQEPGQKDAPAGAVPARVDDLVGLPPSFIGVGDIDLFVDEDIVYARRLIDAGVPTELVVVPGAFHGFILFAPDTTISEQFNEATYNALRRAFGQTIPR